MEIKLHMFRIRFDTFTIEKITKGVKATWIDKLSHIGGTVGLFNGFSFISVFEFLVFGIYMFINHCICFQKKHKGLDIVKDQSKENDNQKIYDDIKNGIHPLASDRITERTHQTVWRAEERNKRLGRDTKKFIEALIRTFTIKHTAQKIKTKFKHKKIGRKYMTPGVRKKKNANKPK